MILQDSTQIAAILKNHVNPVYIRLEEITSEPLRRSGYLMTS
jgi:hypothetical protein